MIPIHGGEWEGDKVGHRRCYHLVLVVYCPWQPLPPAVTTWFTQTTLKSSYIAVSLDTIWSFVTSAQQEGVLSAWPHIMTVVQLEGGGGGNVRFIQSEKDNRKFTFEGQYLFVLTQRETIQTQIQTQLSKWQKRNKQNSTKCLYAENLITQRINHRNRCACQGSRKLN